MLQWLKGKKNKNKKGILHLGAHCVCLGFFFFF